MRLPQSLSIIGPALVCIISAVLLGHCAASANGAQYSVTVVSIDESPVLSSLDGTSKFTQNFNPSWIAPSDSLPGLEYGGLFVRCQNCSDGRQNCPGSASPSVIAFARALDRSGVKFAPIDASTIAFSPSESVKEETWGTEDPRVAVDPHTGEYHLFYTAYAGGIAPGGGDYVKLHHAVTKTPSVRDSWTRLGAVFPELPNSKSGALLVRKSPPHYLFWGDSSITVATTDDLVVFTNQKVIVAPRSDGFDSVLVESGPPPMELSDGNILFVHNSADATNAYHVGWVILNGTDPTEVLARSASPLLSPTLPWEEGTAPFLSNVPNVVFLEAMRRSPSGTPDEFQVWFGGADAVVGTATIRVTLV